MAIKERLTEKAGPLPVYGWAVIIGVVLFGIVYWQRKKSSAANANTDSAPADTAQDEADTIPAATAAEMQAEYSLSNQLGLATSGVANLATNVGRNTTATTANTVADKANTQATSKNTTAETHNTSATKQGTAAQKSNTVAVKGNTRAITRKTPHHAKHPPVRHRTKR